MSSAVLPMLDQGVKRASVTDIARMTRGELKEYLDAQVVFVIEADGAEIGVLLGLEMYWKLTETMFPSRKLRAAVPRVVFPRYRRDPDSPPKKRGRPRKVVPNVAHTHIPKPAPAPKTEIGPAPFEVAERADWKEHPLRNLSPLGDAPPPFEEITPAQYEEAERNDSADLEPPW